MKSTAAYKTRNVFKGYNPDVYKHKQCTDAYQPSQRLNNINIINVFFGLSVSQLARFYIFHVFCLFYGKWIANKIFIFNNITKAVIVGSCVPDSYDSLFQYERLQLPVVPSLAFLCNDNE